MVDFLKADNVEQLGIYLDQSVYGHMLDESPHDWAQSEMGKVLMEANRAEKALVWVGPTNVIETMQCSNLERRKQLALMMLALSESRRMSWGVEYETVDDFFSFLEVHAPGAIRCRDYFDYYGTTMRQIWLGGLGLIAATGALHTTDVVEELKKMKAVNRLIHARIGCSPDQSIDQFVDAAEKLATTNDNVFAEFDSMTIVQIERETDRLAKSVIRIGKNALKKLNDNRNRVCRAYGAVEVGFLLERILRLPLELEFTFNAAAIVAAWPKMQTSLKCRSLPKGNCTSRRRFIVVRWAAYPSGREMCN